MVRYLKLPGKLANAYSLLAKMATGILVLLAYTFGYGTALLQQRINNN
jgi:hypothetical protein